MKLSVYLLSVLFACSLTFGQTQYKVLYSFGGVPNDGLGPYGLITDSAGNLYGATAGGGTAQSGTVFELSPQSGGTWAETVLYNFCSQTNCSDGYGPEASLAFDANGNLYGVTTGGGANCANTDNRCGTAFELSPPQQQGGAWVETVLYNFCSNYQNRICLDGFEPKSQLAIDGSGNLYGTTNAGGSGAGTYAGVAFELSPGSNGWIYNVIYNFCSHVRGSDFCQDGYTPAGGVMLDKSGNLYGTTVAGGQFTDGIVYKLTPSQNGWTLVTLVQLFGGGRNNEGSTAPVTFDSRGNLYGTTIGTAFQLNAKHQSMGSRTFTDATGYRSPGGVLVDPVHNALFGTAIDGGANELGTIWEVNPTRQLVPIYSFCSQPGCADGYQVESGLAEDSSGNIYGTTGLGGANDAGVIFQITP